MAVQVVFADGQTANFDPSTPANAGIMTPVGAGHLSCISLHCRRWTGVDYMGERWLASFAVFLLSTPAPR
jgi:hypothetical protein